MNRILVPLFFIVSIVVMISGVEIWRAYSCGPIPDYEELRISWVDPDLLDDSLYQSFYRTLLRPHQRSDQSLSSEIGAAAGSALYGEEYDDNLRQWSEYFRGRIPLRSIEALIYGLSSEDIGLLRWSILSGLPLYTKGSLFPHADRGDRPGAHLYSAARREVIRRRDLAFLRYMEYALATSRHAWDPSADRWDNKPQGTAEMLGLIQVGLKLYHGEQNPDLRTRYGFQIVRLARYLGHYAEAETFFNELLETPSTDRRHPARLMAMAHVAGARRRRGDSVGAGELFAHLVDSAEHARGVHLRDFRLGSSDSIWHDLYDRARTPHQRANLHFIRGLGENRLGFGYVRRMYRLDPGSAKLEVALMRELHRIESLLYDEWTVRNLQVQRTGRYASWYSEEDTNVIGYDFEAVNYHLRPGGRWDSLYYYSFGPPDSMMNRERHLDRIVDGASYVRSFRQFTHQVAREGRVTEPALWYMVTGYIDLMNRDYWSADRMLRRAALRAIDNPDLEKQIRLLQYLGDRMSGRTSPFSTDDIVDVLTWMQRKQRKNLHSKSNRTMAELGRRYLADHDVARAILAFHHVPDFDYYSPDPYSFIMDVYASDRDLQDLTLLISNPPTDRLDSLLLDSCTLTVDELKDIRATKMMRNGEYRKARDLYRTISSEYWYDTVDQWGYMRKHFRTNCEIVDPWLPAAIPQGTGATELLVTHLDFAEELVQTIDRAGRLIGPERSRELLAVGDLLFNNVSWGTNWWVGNQPVRNSMPSYGRRGLEYPMNIPEIADRLEKELDYYLDYFGLHQNAREWYEQVVRLNADAELAARAAYMMDLCDKQPASRMYEGVPVDRQPREGYNLLMQKYRDTEMGKAILSQCSVYRNF